MNLITALANIIIIGLINIIVLVLVGNESMVLPKVSG